MDGMCDLSAKSARVSKLIRCLLSPAGADGGCGVVMSSKSCTLAVGWFVCFAGSERRINVSAGLLVGVSGISPVGSMMAGCAMFVLLVSVSNHGRGRASLPGFS